MRAALLTAMLLLAAHPPPCGDLLPALRAAPSLSAPEHAELREDLASDSAVERSELFDVPRSQRRLLVVHAGWSVALAEVSPSCEVQRAWTHPAKLGFSTAVERGSLVVTLHEHGGTGLFSDQPVRVRARNGRLSVSFLPAVDIADERAPAEETDR